MSMLCLLKEISDSDIHCLIENPKRVELLLNNGEYFANENQSFFQKLFSRKKHETKIDSWKPVLNSKECDIDKTWDILHHLLTNGADDLFPLNFIGAGGVEIGEDYGYGPIRVMNSDEVFQLNTLLVAIIPQTLRERFSDPSFVREGIYPDFESWEEAGLSWVIEAYEELKIFIEHLSNSKTGL